jgi:O-antigen ligase
VKKDLKGEPNILNKLIVFYLIIVLLSSFFSEYPDLSFSRLRIFFDWFIIYFAIANIVNNEKRFYIFFLSFLIYSFKMSQHGFFSWASRGFAFEDWGVTGAPGWFHNSGEVGIQMCIFIPLSISYILANFKNLSKKWLVFFLFMPFTGIATVIASSSRGAFIGLALASMRPLLIKPRLFFKTLIVISITVIVVINYIPEEFMIRFKSIGTDRTSMHRIERWKDGIDAMNEYPLLGVGFEVWSKYYPKKYILSDLGSLLVHNIFVQCGSELGYLGLSIFIFMIIACFVVTHKVRILCQGDKDQYLPILSYGFDSALLGFIGSGFFVTVLYYPYFWIHCAMVVCLYKTAIIKSRSSIPK